MWVALLSKKRRGNASVSRKITPYVMRDLEPKLEECMRGERKFVNWKMRQKQKLKKTQRYYVDVSEFPRKKVLKEPRKKKKLINIQKKTSYKLTKEPAGKQACLLWKIAVVSALRSDNNLVQQ